MEKQSTMIAIQNRLAQFNKAFPTATEADFKLAVYEAASSCGHVVVKEGTLRGTSGRWYIDMGWQFRDHAVPSSV